MEDKNKYIFEDHIITTNSEQYICIVKWRSGEFVSDEPISLGGTDVGPDPFTLLVAALATCTLNTMRMYINRKGWDIEKLEVEINLHQDQIEGKKVTYFDRIIKLPLELEIAVKEKLLMIAGKCPVSQILIGQAVINDQLQ